MDPRRLAAGKSAVVGRNLWQDVRWRAGEKEKSLKTIIRLLARSSWPLLKQTTVGQPVQSAAFSVNAAGRRLFQLSSRHAALRNAPTVALLIQCCHWWT